MFKAQFVLDFQSIWVAWNFFKTFISVSKVLAESEKKMRYYKFYNSS